MTFRDGTVEAILELSELVSAFIGVGHVLHDPRPARR
jgi:hypothetical protein